METVILIPHYNNKHILDDCLNSLRKQTYKNFKIVLVDDGSTDGSSIYVRERFPEIEIHALGVNRGFAKTVNEGLRYILKKYNPPFIALLNNDTRADENWLTAIVQKIKTDEKIAAVTSNMLFYDHPDIINGQGGTLDWNGDGYDVNFGIQKKKGKKESNDVLGACWGAALIRTDALRTVGFLDETFDAYFEDLDWSWRANLFGYRVVFEKDAVIYHKHSASYRNNNYKKIYLCKRNALRAAIKNYESKELGRRLALIFLGYWFSIVGYFQRRKINYLTVPLQALGWNLLHLAGTLRERRQIQRKRRINDAAIEELVKSDLTPARIWLKNFKNRWALFSSSSKDKKDFQEIRRLARNLYQTSGSFLQGLLLRFENSPFFLKLFSKMYLEKGLIAYLTAKAHALYNRLPGLNSKFKNRKLKIASWGVNVFGFLDSESGVGEAGRTLVRSMLKAGIPLTLINDPNVPHRRQEKEFSRFFGKKNPYAINVIAIYGDVFERELTYFGQDKFKDRYNIAYWTWELERLPNSWIRLLDRVDEVWTPSAFSANAVKQARPDLPVTVIPHAIEIKKYKYRRADYGLPENIFLFLFTFDFYSIFERKNPLAVVRAFKKSFQKNETVELIIKCSNSEIDPVNFQLLKAETAGYPIRVIDSYLERERVDGLMNVCDCYISLHRSEGFGLTIAEAMAFGKPVIATNYSGNTDFMTEENSFPVDYKLIKLERDYGPYKKGNVWAEPDVDDAARKMRLIYENQEVAARKAGKARRDVAVKLNPGEIGRLVSNRLQEINKNYSN